MASGVKNEKNIATRNRVCVCWDGNWPDHAFQGWSRGLDYFFVLDLPPWF